MEADLINLACRSLFCSLFSDSVFAACQTFLFWFDETSKDLESFIIFSVTFTKFSSFQLYTLSLCVVLCFESQLAPAFVKQSRTRIEFQHQSFPKFAGENDFF